MSTKKKLSKLEWCDEHFIGLFYLGLIVCIAIFFMFNLETVIAFHDGMMQFGKDLAEANKKFKEKSRDIGSVVKSTTDCKELTDNIDWLIVRGANDDAWFPDKNSQNLKIAKERFDLYC